MKKNSKKKNSVVSGPKPVPAGVETLPLTEAEVNQLRTFDQEMATAKLRLADAELQLSELQAQKGELVRLLKEGQAKFLSDVNKMATDHGIELDASKDARRWNLDTNQMVFQLLK